VLKFYISLHNFHTQALRVRQNWAHHNSSSSSSLTQDDQAQLKTICSNQQLLLFNTSQGSEKPVFLKSPNNWVFWVLLGFGLYWVFGLLYLIEQLGILLADLADQLSFYLDSPVL